MDERDGVTISGIVLNTVLFILKLLGGILSNSIAVLSDAFNSLTDIVASVAIFVAVRMAKKKADACHPFGHHRAEPLAGVIVAIFAAVLGFEILKNAIGNLFADPDINFGILAISILAITILTKSVMAMVYFRKGWKLHSPGILAAAVDSRNDILASSIALVGVIASMMGIRYIDSVAAILISCFIFYSAYDLGVRNIDYLMGKAADPQIIRNVKNIVRKIKGVKGTNDIFTHYVGTFLHIEIHIEVGKSTRLDRAHDIGKKVQHAIEAIPAVDRAFVHIDPR